MRPSHLQISRASKEPTGRKLCVPPPSTSGQGPSASALGTDLCPDHARLFSSDKRPATSKSFTGFQAPFLARRDSSLKRLTRWGSQGDRTPSPSSSELQKPLNGADEAPPPVTPPQEDKLDPPTENEPV